MAEHLGLAFLEQLATVQQQGRPPDFVASPAMNIRQYAQKWI
jgi:hypothetical protein